MKARALRARRGEIGLMKLESGLWGIRWGRRLAREAGLPFRESTQTLDRAEAQAILTRRRIEVYRGLGADDLADQAARRAPPIPLDRFVTDFLKEYAAGKLPGRRPRAGTIELCTVLLLGAKGGFLPFAERLERTTTAHLDAILVMRWLEEESRRLASDSIRLKLAVTRRLVVYGELLGLVRKDVVETVRAVKPPKSAKGRARVDGVPSELEVRRLLEAMKPRYSGKSRPRPKSTMPRIPIPFHRLAELQLRLGLRRAEVVALEASWLVECGGRVRIPGTITKSGEPRDVDGVDAETFALAREIIALKAQLCSITVSAYKEAWKRACARLEKAGTPWRYRNKSHALRSVYATMSRLAGIPLSVVRDRLGHSSERVTERHYLGRTADHVPGPFADKPLFVESAEPMAKVIPLNKVV